MTRPRTGRTKQVAVLLSSDEHARLVEVAARYALTPASYLRARIDKERPSSRGRMQSSCLSPEITRRLTLALLSIKRDTNDLIRRVRRDGSRAVSPGEIEMFTHAVDRLADAFEGVFGRVRGAES